MYHEPLSRNSLNRGKMTSNKKCSYFCVGCLSPNSLMFSCKESWRQKRRETSWVGVGVEEWERSLAL